MRREFNCFCRRKLIAAKINGFNLLLSFMNIFRINCNRPNDVKNRKFVRLAKHSPNFNFFFHVKRKHAYRNIFNRHANVIRHIPRWDGRIIFENLNYFTDDFSFIKRFSFNFCLAANRNNIIKLDHRRRVLNASVRQSRVFSGSSTCVFFYIIRVNSNDIASALFWVANSNAFTFINRLGNKLIAKKRNQTFSNVGNYRIFSH